jgi:hypothetical protein
VWLSSDVMIRWRTVHDHVMRFGPLIGSSAVCAPANSKGVAEVLDEKLELAATHYHMVTQHKLAVGNRHL